MAQPKNKVQSVKLDQLTPDDLNANQHTENGMRLLEKSVSELGLGRSILIDKNNRIIAGNGVVETASQLGLMDVVVVETNGKQLVAVKRTDLDMDSKEARELAVADNAVGKANLSWDDINLEKIKADWNVDTEAWGVAVEFKQDEEKDTENEKKQLSTQLIVECGSAANLSELFNELQDRGFRCKLKE